MYTVPKNLRDKSVANVAIFVKLLREYFGLAHFACQLYFVNKTLKFAFTQIVTFFLVERFCGYFGIILTKPNVPFSPYNIAKHLTLLPPLTLLTQTINKTSVCTPSRQIRVSPPLIGTSSGASWWLMLHLSSQLHINGSVQEVRHWHLEMFIYSHMHRMSRRNCVMSDIPLKGPQPWTQFVAWSHHIHTRTVVAEEVCYIVHVCVCARCPSIITLQLNTAVVSSPVCVSCAHSWAVWTRCVSPNTPITAGGSSR